MCIVVKFLSIKLNFNVDHFNWPVSIVYCFLVRVRVFVRVCLDACVFSFLRVFVFSFINSQPWLYPYPCSKPVFNRLIAWELEQAGSQGDSVCQPKNGLF